MLGKENKQEEKAKPNKRYYLWLGILLSLFIFASGFWIFSLQQNACPDCIYFSERAPTDWKATLSYFETHQGTTHALIEASSTQAIRNATATEGAEAGE